MRVVLMPSGDDIRRRIATLRAHPLSQNTMNASNPHMEPGRAVVSDISVMAGWLEALEDCFREIESLSVDERPAIHQIKEKFGAPHLRFSGGSTAAKAAIERCLERCETRCQVCGSDARRVVIDGWHVLLCKTHAELCRRVGVANVEKIWLGEAETAD